MEDSDVKVTDGSKPIDELQFVDEEIRNAFIGDNYLIGTPSLVQLNKNLAKIIKILEERL